jgi:hypothetical protein
LRAPARVCDTGSDQAEKGEDAHHRHGCHRVRPCRLDVFCMHRADASRALASRPSLARATRHLPRAIGHQRGGRRRTLGRARLLSSMVSPTAPPVRGSSRPASEPAARCRRRCARGGGEGVRARAVPDPLQSGNTPVMRRKQGVYARFRRGCVRRVTTRGCRRIGSCRHVGRRAADTSPMVAPGPAAWDGSSLTVPLHPTSCQLPICWPGAPVTYAGARRLQGSSTR